MEEELILGGSAPAPTVVAADFYIPLHTFTASRYLTHCVETITEGITCSLYPPLNRVRAAGRPAPYALLAN